MIGKTTELPRALPLISPPRADELLSSWLTRIAQDYYIPPRGLLMVPLPYNIWAKQADDANTTPTVRMTGLRTHNMGSLITTCHGDEAGTGGGIKSGTHNGICEPMEHSATVRTEGKNAIRHNDLWWMNNRNTIGRLLWVKEPDTTGLTPQSQKGWQVADMSGAASPAPSTNSNTTLAFAPSAGFVAPEAATAGSGAASVGAGEATVGTGEAVGGGWLASLAWPLALAVPILLGMTTSTGGKQRADGTYEDEMPREKTEAPPAGRTAGNCNVSGQERKPPCPCITGPYDKIKDRCKAECGDGAQAHHIVPDGLLGVQNRAAREGGAPRIPTPDGSAPLPAFDAGPAICLQGNAADKQTEHNTAHCNDKQIYAEGAQSAVKGTISLGRAMDLSVAQAKAARPDCAADIDRAVDAGFGAVDKDTLVRATRNPPKAGSPADLFLNPPPITAP